MTTKIDAFWEKRHVLLKLHMTSPPVHETFLKFTSVRVESGERAAPSVKIHQDGARLVVQRAEKMEDIVINTKG